MICIYIYINICNKTHIKAVALKTIYTTRWSWFKPIHLTNSIASGSLKYPYIFAPALVGPKYSAGSGLHDDIHIYIYIIYVYIYIYQWMIKVSQFILCFVGSPMFTSFFLDCPEKKHGHLLYTYCHIRIH